MRKIITIILLVFTLNFVGQEKTVSANADELSSNCEEILKEYIDLYNKYHVIHVSKFAVLTKIKKEALALEEKSNCIEKGTTLKGFRVMNPHIFIL